ncbi:MAG: RluA family pseudouridine synthase [Bacteroidales bacterium]|nr:RluA family pseudouridine synthase [Bacteroidales bacterium]
MSNFDLKNRILYEDNHIIVVVKLHGEISQGDKTNDVTLPDLIKDYIKKKYNKPGNVFLGVVHRLDRPVGGVMVFAKTSKALKRLNAEFSNKTARKTYLAITCAKPNPEQNKIKHFLEKNEKLNKSFVSDKSSAKSKEAILRYKWLGDSDKYSLVEIELLTGRHHQIRAQMAHIGCVIKGDLKYGAKRSNPDGNLSLLAWKLSIKHPISNNEMFFTAPLPQEQPWIELSKFLKED